MTPSPTSCCARSGSSRTFTRAVTRAFGQPSACAAPSSVRPRSSIARTALASSYGVELLARNVLDRAVGILGLGVAHHDRHIGQTERAGGGDPVKTGDELEAVAVIADQTSGT